MDTTSSKPVTRMVDRFRGFLPVVVDVETGGFDPQRDALLEIAVAVTRMDNEGTLRFDPPVLARVQPFEGANLDPRALEVTGIDPDHPLRAAVTEREALDMVFKPVREAVRASGCQRAVLVGHNAAFDLGFLNAAVNRCNHKRNPFHPFSCFDTATLGGLAYGQTVLSRAVQAAGFDFDAREAHSAVYDTERTAQLFCTIVNRWKELQDLERDHVGLRMS
ncbi:MULTISPECIES: ribonuclease T [Oleiagrimonas]|uniref:Ribonuclease T n=1 Tax=Oleiagrimonas citrea TaxID=1665687 RepID=A0A846ZKV9_9GAMM|nr:MULTISPECIES: ribonuclease T [Oleiagrimonas]NKZ38814.1 ribonuclease T [Oleiagrimonas citrea]RAP59201.1 ribonuclease T [Oleiagrimonas sp. MCCC 1A03011]